LFLGEAIWRPTEAKIYYTLVIIVLAVIILVTSILGLISAYSRRRCVVYVYMVIVAVALILQVVVGVLVYQKGANFSSYINTLWSSSSNADRLAIQDEVSLDYTL
jgi:Tetraspanin family